MPTKMELNSVLSDDRNSVTMTLVMDGLPLGHIILEIPDVEDLIHRMATVRAAMIEPVPSEIEPAARIIAADNPAWRVKIPTSSPTPGILLALRHPGLGWLINLLPREEAHNLGQSLLGLSKELER